MGDIFATITPELTTWINEQHLFFVATAPLAGQGLINCSPKGLDSFRILDPKTVAYADLTGSGVETAAHLKENGRIVVMFAPWPGHQRSSDCMEWANTLNSAPLVFSSFVTNLQASRGCAELSRLPRLEFQTLAVTESRNSIILASVSP